MRASSLRLVGRSIHDSGRQGRRCAAALALLAFVGLAFVGVVAPVQGKDFDARSLALIHDAVSTPGAAGASVDPAATQQAIKALSAAKLVSGQRVSVVEPDIVDHYGRAMMLGARTRQFLPELAAVRNAALRRDRDETAKAIAALYRSAGRNVPHPAAMEKLVDTVTNAGAGEGPAETQRQSVVRPGMTIETTDARRAGLYTIEVTETPPGGEPQRTVVVAEPNVAPDAAGTGLTQRAVPIRACTITASKSAELRARLNGIWQSQNSGNWEISGSGEAISLVSREPGKPVLTYVGTYKLGRIHATHPIAAIYELDNQLPGWVRKALIGKTAFVVRLDDCGDGRLEGTWESRHVTYDPGYQTISRIHDPYDLRLALARGLDGTALGASDEEAP